MGIDLTLLPFTADHPGLAFAHTVLDLERDRGLWAAIQPIQERYGQAVPPCFSSYFAYSEEIEDRTYGVMTEDAYGQPLQYVLAMHLLSLDHHPAVTAPVSPRNSAAWAYLAALPANTKVALYWH